jgi:hypothetical protein
MESWSFFRCRIIADCVALPVLFFLMLPGVCHARPKKDVIQFMNGDRITCEIVKLEKGYLYVKLEYANGTVAMDWSKIAHIKSPQNSDQFLPSRQSSGKTDSCQIPRCR